MFVRDEAFILSDVYMTRNELGCDDWNREETRRMCCLGVVMNSHFRGKINGASATCIFF